MPRALSIPLFILCVCAASTASGESTPRPDEAVPVASEQTETFTAPVSDRKQLSLQVPQGWEPKILDSEAGLVLGLQPRGGDESLIMLSVIPSTPGGRRLSVDETQQLAEAIATPALDHAVQEELKLIEIRTDHVVGFLYHLTAAEGTEFPGRYLDSLQGTLYFDRRHFGTVTIYTGIGDTETQELALEVLRTLELGKARRG